MTLLVPDAWKSLKYPNQRHELLLTVQEIIGSTLDIASARNFDVDDVYHFFFDDTDLADETSGYVGLVLFSAEEVNHVSRLTQALDELHKHLGNAPTERYIVHTSWAKVQSLAKETQLALAHAGAPILTWDK